MKRNYYYCVEISNSILNLVTNMKDNREISIGCIAPVDAILLGAYLALLFWF